jgi:hypothetical protein
MTFAPWTLYWPASEGGSLNKLFDIPEDSVVPPNREGASLARSVRADGGVGTTIIDSSALTRQGNASSRIGIKASCVDEKVVFIPASYSKKLAKNQSPCLYDLGLLPAVTLMRIGHRVCQKSYSC